MCYCPRAWRRQWHPTSVLLPGKSHGRRSLVRCSLWGRSESDTTERLHFHFSLSCIGEGNGNPLQYSCLENPRDGGAWWAAVYRVAQSRTQLKRFSSSSSSPRACYLGTIRQEMVFPVVIYGCESWTVKKAERWRIDAFELWCWRRLLRVPWTARRSNKSILKEINPFFGRNDAEAGTPVLWPPHAKSWLIGKVPDPGRDWGQEEKGTTEDEMAGWHHWLDGRESW